MQLEGKRIAVLVEMGFEEEELTRPCEALEAEGAETFIISPQTQTVAAWDHTDWSDSYEVDVPLDQADPADFDALLLPGGVMNPDKLRMKPAAVAFVKAFFDSGKPVAAICHGPWVLIEAGAVRGRRITSWPSLKSDLENAGAQWVDEEVVEDSGLVTSRSPKDIPAFNRRMIELFARGAQSGRTRAA